MAAPGRAAGTWRWKGAQMVRRYSCQSASGPVRDRAARSLCRAGPARPRSSAPQPVAVGWSSPSADRSLSQAAGSGPCLALWSWRRMQAAPRTGTVSIGRRAGYRTARLSRQDDSMQLRIFTEPQQGASYDTLLRVARAAQDLGFDAFFRSDHYLKMGNMSGLPGPTDAWITLAGLARETSRIRLGTPMSPATIRFPGPLAIS